MFRVFCVVIAVLLSLPATAFAAPPNVIVFLLDDARADDLDTMPVVRSIAREGAQFVNAFSPFPLCCPARATLLTGQYAHNHGVTSNRRPTGGFWAFRDEQTLATWLDPAYVTGWAGKYFNEYGTNGSATYIPPGWNEWFAPSLGMFHYTNTTWNWNRVPTRFPGQYQTDTLADFAVNFVNRYAPSSEPFFLVTSFLAPHAGNPFEPDDPKVVYGTPHYPTPSVAPRHQNLLAGLPLAANPAFNEKDTGDKRLQRPLLRRWEIAAITEVNQQRRESLLAVDEAVQRIVEALREHEALDDTYLIFVSDNGYAMGEHRIPSGKNTPYDVAVKVPLVIRGPGIPARCTVRQLAGLHDLAPTILAATGTAGTQGNFVMDGVNLLPMCGDPLLHAGRPIVIEAAPEDGQLAPDWLFQGVVTPLWKFVQRSTGGIELYDRINDPWELENQSQNPVYGAIKAQMRQLKNRLRFCQGSACWQ